MAKVFISYSRRDLESARCLTSELKKNEMDFWIDWEGIPPTVDWWREIEKGIEEADIFLILISPEAARSKYCIQEVECAARNGKRLIPVVVRDTLEGDIPPQLSHLNWIFLRESDDFYAGIEKLLAAIHTDYEWVRSHRRLQVKALEWSRSNKEPSFLLRGRDLEDAELQLATNSSKEPYPTDLQREYVFESHQAANRQRGTFITIGIVGLIVLAALAAFGLVQAQRATASMKIAQSASTRAVANEQTAVYNEQEARTQAHISRVRDLITTIITTRDDNFALSQLLGMEVFHQMPDLPGTRRVMINNMLANPQLLQYLNGHAGFVYTVDFSPDGRILASGGDDSSIILWDVERRMPFGRLLTGETSPYTIAFSPDGRTLAAGNVDGTVALWDIATRKPIGEPSKGHIKDVNSIAFSPDGKIIASGGVDGKIILWNATTRQPIGEPLQGHAGKVWSVKFSPDGRLLASSSDDRSIILWDVETRMPIGGPLTGHEGTVWSLVFTPDGGTLISGGDDKTIRFWEVPTGAPIGTPIYTPSKVYSMDLYKKSSDPEGANAGVLVSGNADNTVTLWDLATRKMTREPFNGHSQWVNSIAFSPDGSLIASAGNDGTVILWDALPRPTTEKTLVAPGPVYSVAFSPDGKTLFSGGETNDYGPLIVRWNLETGQPLEESFLGHTATVWNVSISPDGKTLSSGSADQTVLLWDADTGQAIGDPLTGHTGTVWTVPFSPDGKMVASGSSDGTILLWDVATGRPAGEPLKENYGPVWSLAFSPDGKMLASGSEDGTILLWDLITHKPVGKPLAGHKVSVYSVVFSPDGRTLASTGEDGRIILWDVEKHEIQGNPIEGHGAIYSLAFSPDGKILAAGNLDGVITFWDIPVLDAIGLPFNGHSDYVNSLKFSPDGKTLASGSADGTIILWDMEPQNWIAQSCQRVGRNFTSVEWNLYFPGEPYRKICEQWPSASDPLPTVEAAFLAVSPAPLPTSTTVPATALPIQATGELIGNLNSWTRFMTTGDERQVKSALENGIFRVQISPFIDKLPWVYWIDSSSTYTDVRVDAVVTNNGNNANGVSLICQYSDAGWYEFSVSNAGLYTIYAYDPSLPPLQAHVALATGGAAPIKTVKGTNTYTAICKGNELSLLINRTPIHTLTDRLYNFSEGSIGIGVSSPLKLPVDVQFESVSVSIPE